VAQTQTQLALTNEAEAKKQKKAADDNAEQRWMIFCYDKKTGKKLWQQSAYQGLPRATRARLPMMRTRTPFW